MKKGFLLFVLLFSSFLHAFAAPKATGEIFQVPANPKAGFEWGYVVYIPQHMDTSKPLPLLFVMNDNGMYETQEENEKSVMNRFQSWSGDWVEWGIADGVGVPMVMPMVLRETSKDKPQYLNAHDLNRAVFVLKDGPYARLDLQVLAMLKDARKQLKKRGIRTQKKYLIAGFSSAGSFGYKWTLLHPEYVIAAVFGGEHYPGLPLETYDGINLIYPVGVYDFKTYTGKKFNKKAWLKIPMLGTDGADDYNDPLPYDDVYGEEDRATTLKVFGEGTSQDRYRKARELLAQFAPNIQTHIYPHVGHDWEKQDVINFLNTHKNGGPLQPITLTDTSERPSDLPIKITKLYWGNEAKKILQPHVYQYLGKNKLYMYVKGHNSIPRVQSACQFDVLHQGQVILANKMCPVDLFNETDFTLQGIPFSDEDMVALKKTGGHTFSLRSHYPKIWEVPEHLTFTIK